MEIVEERQSGAKSYKRGIIAIYITFMFLAVLALLILKILFVPSGDPHSNPLNVTVLV